MITVSALTLLPAGEKRLLEAQRRGEQAFGKSLPLRNLSADDGGKIRVYLIGPVCQSGRDQRLAYYDIKIGF